MRIFRGRRIRIFAILAVLLLGTALFGVPGIASADVGGERIFREGEADGSAGDGTGEGDDKPDTSVATSILGGGPSIGAKAAIVMEVGSGAVLYAKNAADSYAPMSLTKLMTALLTIEKLDMTDTVTFSKKSIHSIGSSVTRIGLVEDETLTVLDTLYAMLVASADETAYALGEKMGGGKVDKFLPMMNERMKELGGINTEFRTATGTGGTKQSSCAYDLGLVACELMKYPLFFKIASSKWYEVPATNLKEARMLAQTHAFIRKTKNYEYAIAGKTGGVSSSEGYALCTYAEKDGMTVVAIVLGCKSGDSCYDDTVTALNYVFENYKVYSIRSVESSVNASYTGLFESCPMFDDGTGDLVYIDPAAYVVLPHGTTPEVLSKTISYSIPDEYVHGENVIGHVSYFYSNRCVGNAAIIFNNPEFPMSQAEFEAVWPRFLVLPNMLPSQGGSGVVIDNSLLTANLSPIPTVDPANASPTPVPPTPTPASDLVIEKKPETSGFLPSVPVRTKAWLLGGAIFLVTFVPCILVIFVFLPRRARRKNRVTKRL